MKIALVIDRFLPRKGGGERYVQLLAENLTARGHEVVIFARRFPDSPPSGGYRFHPVRVPGQPEILRIHLFARRCGEATAEGAFDIVHDVGHMTGADIYNPHGGVEQVWLQRYFASYDHPVHRLFKRVQRFLSPKERAVLSLQKRQLLAPGTRRILAIAPMIRDHIRRHYPGIPEEKIVLIENPADLSRFNPENRDRFRDEERARYRLGEGEVALLFAGNNFRLKGLLPLLQSLSVLRRLPGKPRPFRLLVAGTEPPPPWRRRARKLGVADLVTFLGPVSEMARLYAAVDIFVLPTFYDSASLVVLEALASGLPVITSRWNGTASLIDGPATGMVLVRNDDPDEIARAIRTYFPAQARERALALSPRQVRHLSLERHIDRILEIYGEVLSEKSHG